ncbi:TRAP transporter large permease subunit [Chengkuizengella sp. SCS-71B]|uniref:TRAP transporter large permease subunit n=1 Tax=Chengkuizengella sp. SCS-71B TaxID=3115290 RepID=UPI0032C232D5
MLEDNSWVYDASTPIPKGSALIVAVPLWIVPVVVAISVASAVDVSVEVLYSLERATFLMVILVLEATRRILGLPLMILAHIFMGYALIGYKSTPFLDGIIPEAIIHAGYDIQALVTKLNTNLGIFGIPIYVSSTYVIIFVLFGAFFDVTGAGRMFINAALSILGPFRGGPAKAAVIGSGVMGSISGSSVANVVTTGTFTIPLMKRVGFRSKTAGGIEVAASSSGQLLPPIMGAAAFIMAETTGIPYCTSPSLL